MINDEIIFDNKTARVWSIYDVDKKTSLTQTTSRLFVYLINNKGVVISRDEILSSVWKAHGLKTSTNSLNKYISDLRNILRDMGCSEDIILTVPRLGFMISDETKIEPASGEIKKSNIHLRVKGKVFCLIISLVFFIIATTYSLRNENISHSDDLASSVIGGHYIGVARDCKVYTLREEDTLQSSQINISKAEEILEARGLMCSSDEIIYMQTPSLIKSDAVGRVFFAMCRIDNKTLVSCYNYYEIFYSEN